MAKKPKEQAQVQEQAPEQKTPEQIAAEEAEGQAAFSAGFNGDSPPAAEPAQPEEPAAPARPADGEPTAAAPAAPAAPAADAEEEQLYFGLTEPQIKAALAAAGQVGDLQKDLRKVFGKFGEFQQQMATLAQQRGSAPTKLEIKAEALKRLRANYPEIAGDLAEDLSEVFAAATPAAGVPADIEAQIGRVAQEKVDAAVASLNERFLSRFHSDWSDYLPGGPGKTEIDLWLTTQTPEYRDQFLASTDAVFISEGLDKFKAWREQGQAQRQRNTSRLERAIPHGGGSPAAPQTPINDQAAFRRGFDTG